MNARTLTHTDMVAQLAALTPHEELALVRAFLQALSDDEMRALYDLLALEPQPYPLPWPPQRS